MANFVLANLIINYKYSARNTTWLQGRVYARTQGALAHGTHGFYAFFTFHKSLKLFRNYFEILENESNCKLY